MKRVDKLFREYQKEFVNLSIDFKGSKCFDQQMREESIRSTDTRTVLINRIEFCHSLGSKSAYSWTINRVDLRAKKELSAEKFADGTILLVEYQILYGESKGILFE